jgi:DNA-directed RNA polymerase subunit RPC12/RpoP
MPGVSPTSPQRGIVCPECGSPKLRVRRTSRPTSGLKVRYRRCADCGHRLVTEERPRRAKT